MRVRFQNRRYYFDGIGGRLVARIIEILSGLIVATISALGYPGIGLLMGIESACIPLPSEIIMPFSGYLVYTGRFNLWAVATAGAFGPTGRAEGLSPGGPGSNCCPQ